MSIDIQIALVIGASLLAVAFIVLVTVSAMKKHNKNSKNYSREVSGGNRSHSRSRRPGSRRTSRSSGDDNFATGYAVGSSLSGSGCSGHSSGSGYSGGGSSDSGSSGGSCD